MRAIVVGAVESTRTALRAIGDTPGWSVAAVITLPLELGSRHSDFVDLAEDAERLGARLIRTASSNASDVLEAIRSERADYVMVIGWSQICGPGFMDAAGGRVIGYHPAPLPRLRGRAAIPWTILLDEKITAASLFWIDEGVDTGPLLAQHFFHVAPDESAASLYRRHMEALSAVIADALPLLASGAPPRIEQDGRFATWAAKRTAADGRIDWSQPASEVWRLVRAVGRPYPGAFTAAGDDRLLIWDAELSPDGRLHAATPGQVVVCDDGGFVVSCGSGGALRVKQWETSSGRPPRLHSRLGLS